MRLSAAVAGKERRMLRVSMFGDDAVIITTSAPEKSDVASVEPDNYQEGRLTTDMMNKRHIEIVLTREEIARIKDVFDAYNNLG